ncbi:MAG TPA: ABC transporter ATP-binding protein [Clostridiales bacterium]|nr:ABC transporter ATP-binding protein [Clostridiales bacterium]
MLKVNGVTKRYGKLVANKNLNFDIAPAEIAVLLGPNGAGKSTIIKCIAGLLKFEGLIMINSHNNKSLEAKREFAYIPEMPALFKLLTVWEHLEYIARAYSLENWEEKADLLLERFQLSDKKKKLSTDLSKGMQQKLSIICALLPDSKVILFDEPLVGLDPHAIKELKNLIRQLRDEGKAILISTHMLDSVEDFWDKTIIMMDGEIAVQRTKIELENQKENLEDLFFSITEKEGVVL